MDIRLLGRFDVVVDGAALSLGGPRQRAVLAVLAVQANEIVSTDRLVEEVWGGEPPATAVVTLQRYLSHLRRALDGLPLTIETRRPGYVLVVDPELVDAHRFERMVDEGRSHLSSGAVEQAAIVLRGALELWQGEPLADFSFEPLARIETARLEELRWTAVELRIDADLACGRHRDLVPALEALVAAHPLREAYRGQLMRVLHASGRQADALRVYAEGRHVLADELGLDPSPELQRLEQAILSHDPSVDVPSSPRTGGSVGRLPVELTSFVGRSSEVEDVTGLVLRSRLVTLTGVGGSGKSRLGLRVATTLAPAYANGAWLVELGAVLDPALVPRVVARALGVREEPDRDVVDGLVDALQKQHCIVVVDGVEHLLDAIAPLVEHVLTHTTGVRVLATSREILDVPGEAVFQVPTLSVPDASSDLPTLDAAADFDSVRLFLERARSVDAGFRAGDEDAATIAELCRRLDGLPLALELAAARTDVLTLRQLAARLDDRFELLSGGRRTAPPRHRTLRATIAWSYDLLDDREQVLFERLSVFAGSFTVETVEAVCAGDGIEPSEVFHLLTRLLRQSLVVRVHSTGPTSRYRLLDTLREYGRERLRARSDGDEVFRRHAAVFTGIAERTAPALRRPGADRVLDELEVEHVEFRAALAWLLEQRDGTGSCRLAYALSSFWDYRQHLRDGRMWLERVLALVQSLGLPPSREQLWATIEAAYLAFQTDRFDIAIEWADEAFRMLESIPDAAAEARVLTVRGETARWETDLDLAEQLCGRAAELARQCGDAWCEADAYRILSLVSMDRGDTEAGEVAATECLRLYRQTGDVEKTAGAQTLVASFARARRHFARAAELFEESLASFRAIDEPMGLCTTTWCLAMNASQQGDYDAADRFAEESLRRAEQVDFLRGIGRAYQARAEAALGRGALDEAEAFCGLALDRLRARGFTGDVVVALVTATRISLEKGDLDEALRRCDAALTDARARGLEREVGRLLCLRSAIQVRRGNVGEAAAAAHESVLLFSDAGDAGNTATALVALAEVTVAQGCPEGARQYLRAARTAVDDADADLAASEAEDFARVQRAVDAALGSDGPARNNGGLVGVGTARARRHR